ncbi:alpha/beta hydrolase [Brachybacterium huguangmaarense]|uniref:Alpha/beta hydrolase n=1 Tax=Brachybacterium huguangmaarense TaxID=1652028 RepID=A0ABY6G1J1_9MICO|nr:alpha/beta hydrolase [Brachybacterium huguangmaarense]UYG17076.1 alpha/beta hydrolase [Brachybacterium huguangmaarense]
MPAWTPDPVLGAGYVQCEIPLGEDDEGAILATVLHREPDRPVAPDRLPVLVLHGWSDYVFQRELLEYLAARGLDVWALDLRKHGRSLRPWQTATDVASLEDYDAEIGAALDAIGRDRRPLVLAHSSGGLVAALWAMRHPGELTGLVLNSPWLEFHLRAAGRRLTLPVVRRLARRHPHRPVLPPGPDHYARSLHEDFGGEFAFDLEWKPPGGHAFPASTMAAVLEGQGRLHEGRVLEPVLVLHAGRSRFRRRFDEDMRRSDVVLDVTGMDAAARRLGPRVEVAVIDGARHDVFLSEPDARERALHALDAWLDRLRTADPA